MITCQVPNLIGGIFLWVCTFCCNFRSNFDVLMFWFWCLLTQSLILNSTPPLKKTYENVMKLMLITILMLIARLVLLWIFKCQYLLKIFVRTMQSETKSWLKGSACWALEVVQLSFTVLRTVRVQLILKS